MVIGNIIIWQSIFVMILNTSYTREYNKKRMMDYKGEDYEIYRGHTGY